MTIYTHSSRGHLDEMLAAALVVAKTGQSVHRVSSVPAAALEDRSTWIIDIGGVYDPGKLCFDHHQDGELPCSLHLVAQFLGVDLDDPMYDRINEVDCRGFPNWARGAGINREVSAALRSPVEHIILQMWSSADHIKEGDLLHGILTAIGQSMFDAQDKKRERLELLEKEAIFESIRGLEVVIFLERVPNPGWMLTKWSGCPVSVTSDPRSDGMGLYRDDGAPVDFRLIQDHPDVTFCHKSGFFATIKKGADPMDLIERALDSVKF